MVGHRDIVYCCAISSNGRMIATGGRDNTIRLWAASNGDALSTLQGHESEVSGLALVADGTVVISGSYDNTVRVWEAGLQTGDSLSVLRGHDGWVNCVSCSRDGSVAVSGSWDHNLVVWEIDPVSGHGKQRAVLRGHRDWVHCCSMTPDGKTAVSGSDDGTARVWATETCEQLHHLEGHRAGVRCCAVSEGGNVVATGGADNDLRVWALPSCKCRSVLRGHSDIVMCVALIPTEDLLVSGSRDTTLRLWSISRGVTLLTLGGHAGGVRCCALSPDATMIVSGGFDHVVRVWRRNNDVDDEKHADPASLQEAIERADASEEALRLARAQLRRWKSRTATAEMRCATAEKERWAVSDELARLREALASESLRTQSLTQELRASQPFYAVLVGVSQFEPRRNNSGTQAHPRPLPAVARDIDDLSRVLRSRCGFLARQVLTLRNPYADELTSALTSLASDVNEDDDATVFIYISSHGSDRSVCMHDMDIATDRDPNKKHPTPSLVEVVAQFRTKKLILLLDLSHAADASKPRDMMLRTQSQKTMSGVIDPRGLNDLDSGYAQRSAGLSGRMLQVLADAGTGQAVVSACAEGEVSRTAGLNGIFASHVMRALGGDPDDSVLRSFIKEHQHVDVLGLTTYVASQTRLSNRDQNPLVKLPAEFDNFPVASVKVSTIPR